MKEKCDKIIKWRYEYEEMPEEVEEKFNLISCVAFTCIFYEEHGKCKNADERLKRILRKEITKSKEKGNEQDVMTLGYIYAKFFLK